MTSSKIYLRLTNKNDAFLEAVPPIPFDATHQKIPESSAVAFKTVNSTTPTLLKSSVLPLLTLFKEDTVELLDVETELKSVFVGAPIVVLVLEFMS